MDRACRSSGRGACGPRRRRCAGGQTESASSAPTGADQDAGRCDRLAADMHLCFAAGAFDGHTRGLECQLGLIALFAQVQQHDVPRRSLVRALEDGLEQLGGLGVREMSAIAKVSLDQKLRPAGRFLQGDVVVEFEADQVNSGEAFGNGWRPAAAIGQIADADRWLAALGGGFDAETERGAAVMRQFDRLEAAARSIRGTGGRHSSGPRRSARVF